MLLDGEKEVTIKTNGKPMKIIETTPRCFMDYIHNQILEAKKLGKKIAVITLSRSN